MFDIRFAVRENTATREGLARAGIDEASVCASLADSAEGWVAEIGGRIVGFAIVDRAGGSIFALFVHPDFEGRGHGTRLHDAAVDSLVQAGRDQIWLDSAPGTRAHRFYLDRGWTEAGSGENGDVRMRLKRPARKV